jgi:hypothetical protein
MDLRTAFLTPTIDAENLTKICDRDVLAHIQTEDTPENPNPKEPEIHRETGD